jgi:tRNA(Arg) A34 adenosine deaminase TadA
MERKAMSDHERFMRAAIEESAQGASEGNRPFGSVIVDDGTIIGRGRNLVVTSRDPTAHAETMAIRAAAIARGSSDFSNCTIYTTSEPCPMCLAAILGSGFRTLVIGAHRNPSDRRWGTYTVEKFIAVPFCGNALTVVRDVLARECAEVRDGTSERA